MTLDVPALNPQAAVYRITEDLLLVVDEDGARPLAGALLPRIVRLVDGRRSVMEIADALESDATLVEIMITVDELVEEGVLCDGTVAAPGVDSAFERFHARLAARSGAGEVRVVLTSDYLSADLADVNRESLQSGQPWLLVKPVGAVVWIGPFFTPGTSSACWECLAARLRETFPLEAFLERHRGEALTGPFVPPPVAAAIDAAADAAAVWRRSDALQTFDSRSGVAHVHDVDRRPDCPACGHQPHQPGAPRPDLMRHVSPITGLVGRVLTRDAPGPPAHIAVVDHVFPPEIEQADSVWRLFRRRSMAGGATDAEARTSAVGEAVERYSGVFRPSDAGRRATWADLGASAIHPNDVMGFSDAQFDVRAAWNIAHPHAYTRVPDPFDPDEPRAWTALKSLRSSEVRWLPTASCYFRVEPARERRTCIADSNGCAAGPTFDAAVVSGFLELIERDAVGIWWQNRIDRPGVDLPTVDDPLVQSVRAMYERLGRDLRVLDITTDLGVPAYAALSSARTCAAAGLTLGFGAHFNPLAALRHALIEMNLFLPELASGRRRAICSGPEPAGSYLWPSRLETWAGAGERGRSIADVEAVATGHGLDVFVLDQTRADVGIPVARVVAPGLCHFWARRGARRLFDVPVALGWRARPAAESDLNDSLLLL